MKPFIELTTREKAIELLRWVGVIPAAVLGGYAAYVVFVLQNMVVHYLQVGPYIDFFQRFLLVIASNAVAGVVTVIAGAMTAPRCRRVTAIVLAISWTVLYSGRVLTSFPGEYTGFEDRLSDVVQAIGAFGGAYYIHVTESRKAEINARIS
jgi:hypothetical protein